jgi:hypothetical protein
VNDYFIYHLRITKPPKVRYLTYRPITMPTFTRDQGKRIKDHVFQNVLGQDADSPIERSLNKNMLDNIQAMSTMGRDVIRALNYDTTVGTDTTTKDLNPGQ